MPVSARAQTQGQILDWKPRKATARPRWKIPAIATVCLVVLVLGSFWPFFQGRVLQQLQQAGDSKVQAGRFHRIYFPAPGCVLENVVFQHGATAKPLITIAKLTIRGSYLGLLTRHLSKITAEGMVVSIPPSGTAEAFHVSKSKVTTDEIVADGAVLDFISRDTQKGPLRFEIHHASLLNVGWSGPLTYRLQVRNPEPPAEVAAQGKFGVWNIEDAGRTPISGEYTMEHADLSAYGGIAGKLSASGRFDGPLAHIDISGRADIPNFEVKSGGHPTRLKTDFSAYIDAIHGDTFLKQVKADFGKTQIAALGSIAGSPNGNGKTAIIDLDASNARIEDLLELFVKKAQPLMSGNVKLHARVELPSGEGKFLQKLTMRGGFGIEAGKLSKPSTQENVNTLSAGARGEKGSADRETVLTDLTGKVTLQHGIAAFSDLAFGVPGAAARMRGTYNLINKKIDLRGQLQVDNKISNTESGSKAFLLKMMEPFFKKKKKGKIVPVRISGTFEHPSFGLDVADPQAKKVPDPGRVRP